MMSKREVSEDRFPLVPTTPPRRPLWRQMLGLPGTRLGWWAVRGLTGFFLCFAVFQIMVAAGQRGGDTFFANPWLSITIMTAGISAIAGAVMAAVALIWKGERSITVFLTLVFGLFVLVFALGEILVPH